MSKESQIRAHKEELNQRLSVLTLPKTQCINFTLFFYAFGEGHMSLTLVNISLDSSYLSK